MCADQQTSEIITQIQQQLKDKGYYTADNTAVLDARTKAALTQYQKASRLPVGQLDLETLDALGVVIE